MLTTVASTKPEKNVVGVSLGFVPSCGKKFQTLIYLLVCEKAKNVEPKLSKRALLCWSSITF